MDVFRGERVVPPISREVFREDDEVIILVYAERGDVANNVNVDALKRMLGPMVWDPIDDPSGFGEMVGITK